VHHAAALRHLAGRAQSLTRTLDLAMPLAQALAAAAGRTRSGEMIPQQLAAARLNGLPARLVLRWPRVAAC
jgi:hypothetical protein